MIINKLVKYVFILLTSRVCLEDTYPDDLFSSEPCGDPKGLVGYLTLNEIVWGNKLKVTSRSPLCHWTTLRICGFCDSMLP